MRLARADREAITMILNERLAGGTENLRDALGISLDEAIRLETRLERIVRTYPEDQ